MFDTEALILAVEKYPCLWNITNEHYHDRDMKDFAWEQVCVEIHEDYENIEEKDKRIYLCAETKKKWNNVRDCYRRDINKFKNTQLVSTAKKPKKYIYSDLLSFLTSTLQSKSREGNDCDGNSSTDVIKHEIEYQSDEAEEDQEEHTIEKVFTERRRKSIQSSKNNVSNEIFDSFKQRRQNSIEENDDDTMFLLSFRSDLKEMSKSQKVDFKIGMLQLLKKINEPNL